MNPRFLAESEKGMLWVPRVIESGRETVEGFKEDEKGKRRTSVLCADTSIRGPNGHMSIKRTSYHVSERQPGICHHLSVLHLIYVGKTCRSLAVRFSEHLADIRHNSSKPVAHHFNSAGPIIADVKVKGLWLNVKRCQVRHLPYKFVHNLLLWCSWSNFCFWP